MNAPQQGAVLAVGAIRYLDELAAEIVASGDPAGDMVSEMAAAHARRQAFCMEMHVGKTSRSKKARKVLTARIWGRCVANAAVRRAFDGFEHEQQNEARLFALGLRSA